VLVKLDLATAQRGNDIVIDEVISPWPGGRTLGLDSARLARLCGRRGWTLRAAVSKIDEMRTFAISTSTSSSSSARFEKCVKSHSEYVIKEFYGNNVMTVVNYVRKK
jgi:hypothetical protein